MARARKLEPIFSYRVDDNIKGVINVYAFDTDYDCFIVVSFVKDGPYDEQIFACGSFKDAKELVEYATTTAGDANAFKVLLKDKKAMQWLQEVISDTVEGEWW